ncbi:ribosome assembly RNA-binding protein YhbY [Enterococcus nangangensis]|uniref:ribosome assembly RNA-binding protein YhbY n=1 Tax=Enterococcus nangangensis TaxID=2559926 RepID=UPI0010F8025E|nr:ribosome assembly RNA-binding protein YhbY [Enterococcus nangangensis]
MELKGKQKRYLRAQAHHLNPLFQVGKGGVNEEMLKQIDEALAKRELIKINLLQNTDLTPGEVAETLQNTIDCEVVQIIGKVLVLFKVAPKEKYRKISPKVFALGK